MREIQAYTFNGRTFAENLQEAKRLADWVRDWYVKNKPYDQELGIQTSALSITLRQLVATEKAAPAAPLNADELAQAFHESYERLAPQFSYETRKASAKPWAEVPENNRKLMTAVCAEILGRFTLAAPQVREETKG